jgi:hypothetical protein
LDTAAGRLDGIQPCTSNVPQRSHSNQPFPARFPFIHRMIRAQYGQGVSGMRGSMVGRDVVAVIISPDSGTAESTSNAIYETVSGYRNR